MERKKGRLEVLQEGLATQLAEFKTDMIDKDLKKVAKSGRFVQRSSEFCIHYFHFTLQCLVCAIQRTK